MCERKHREKEKCNIWCQRNALVNGIHGWTIKYWLKTETKQKEFTAAASRFFFFAWRLKIKVLNRKQKAVNCCLSFVYLDACCWRFFCCLSCVDRQARERARFRIPFECVWMPELFGGRITSSPVCLSGACAWQNDKLDAQYLWQHQKHEQCKHIKIYVSKTIAGSRSKVIPVAPSPHLAQVWFFLIFPAPRKCEQNTHKHKATNNTCNYMIVNRKWLNMKITGFNAERKEGIFVF